MWRREERLKYWLENRSQPRKSGKDSRPNRKLGNILRLRICDCAVREEALNLSTGSLDLEDALVAEACVRDGLEDLKQGAPSEFRVVSGIPAGCGGVHTVMLPQNARISNVRFPDERFPRIHYEAVTMTPACFSRLLGLRAAEVHDLAHPLSHPPMLRDGSRFLIADPQIQTLTTQMAELPHMRASVRIESMPDSERKAFLREAEALKGIQADHAELLAVFRRVPIEVISRLRFVAEKRTILYSISRAAQLSRTRVHDLAAVLDGDSKEIHLVPHRTQYRSVSLN